MSLRTLRKNGSIAASGSRLSKASERWTYPVQNWNLTLSQMTIHFPQRLDEYISL